LAVGFSPRIASAPHQTVPQGRQNRLFDDDAPYALPSLRDWDEGRPLDPAAEAAG